MANEKKSNLHENSLAEFMHRVKYNINEIHYRPLVGVDEEFDELPKTNEAGEQEDAPKPAGGAVPPEPTNDQPVGAEEPTPAATPATPVPAFDQSAGGEPAPEGDMPPENPPAGGAIGGAMPPAAPAVDDVQNDIIKHNIEAMKAIHDQLEGLNGLTQSLNAKLDQLSGEVEEVREPTNTEQLMAKKEVSQPYYYNLNDFWSDNWFNQQREKENSKGIKEMPDGTFVADFDDLPQKSKIDVQNSFNEI